MDFLQTNWNFPYDLRHISSRYNNVAPCHKFHLTIGIGAVNSSYFTNDYVAPRHKFCLTDLTVSKCARKYDLLF
jgi:hypothetical protein